MAVEQNARHNIRHIVCPYLILGLQPSAKLHKVQTAYARLNSAFAEENFMDSPQAWVQAQQACMNIENAYKRIMSGDLEGSNKFVSLDQEEYVNPKLGQMLVAAGIITLEELEQAIAKQKTLDLRLGEILKNMSLISQMELDSFLLNQRLITMPPYSPHRFGERLIGLGLVTEDMVRIALIEQRASGKELGQVLVDRGWLAEEILQALSPRVHANAA